ncbi:hypothetical protein GOBAR_AA08177 [Gossypium barbadense]|uniref:Exocyst subunit Exo70 family protein n=1 Tax=Gossypium barbadense TaxID=3634 RepID=A0A2P5YA43_GOSBA|nr:hypothetical protein GOBAR_AA08177 [Gossypium barbadense]
MGVPQAMAALRDKAALVRESLQKSQTITESMVSILGSFDHRLSSLETAMRPTQIRTHSIRRAHENIDKTLKAAEAILGRFDLTRKAEAKILRGPHEDLESYLEAIDQLRSNLQYFTTHKCFKSTSEWEILKCSTRSLNFSKVVEPDRLFDGLPDSLRPSATSPGKRNDSKKDSDNQKNSENAVYTPPTLIPPRVLPLLQNLAQQMVQAGHQQQLFRIYDTRASVLEQSLRKLGVERLSKDDVQKMQWEVLEAKIGNWIHYMRIAVRIRVKFSSVVVFYFWFFWPTLVIIMLEQVKLLFAGEKKICDQILAGIDSLRDQCYAEITANSVSVLLSFGEAIAKSKRSPEKLFVLLDMYEIMRELQSEIDYLFGTKSCTEMRESAQSLTKRLAQTAQETFGDFEEAVAKDATKTAVLDGTVHPLTSYVINYVKFLFDYKTTLEQLFQEFEESDTEAQLKTLTTRIMDALQTNLDGKSKQYKDPALTQLFLMNNMHYIVRSVRRSEAKDLLGDDWVQIHRRIVQQHANQYKRISWAKVLQCVTIQGVAPTGGGGILGGDSGSGISRAMVKDRFKNFNAQFEDLHMRQCQWNVPDSELRESLRLAVAEVLLPAYRSFHKRFGQVLPMAESGKSPCKYIKYKPEDLERMLSEFFEEVHEAVTMKSTTCVRFQYKRLSVFCFLCGQLGHGESFCSGRAQDWDVTLRAGPRRGPVVNSCWLRGDHRVPLANLGVKNKGFEDVGEGELSRVMFSKHNLEDRPGEVDDGKKRARVALGATSASDTVDSSVFGIDHVMSVDHPVSEDSSNRKHSGSKHRSLQTVQHSSSSIWVSFISTIDIAIIAAFDVGGWSFCPHFEREQ